MQRLSELGTRIARESAAAQARDVFSKQEKVRKRWRYVFTEVSLKKNEINANNNHKRRSSSRKSEEKENLENGNAHTDIVGWAESALVGAGANFNVSELEELKEGIRVLQGLQVDLITQRVGLDELAARLGENSTIYQNSRVKLERVNLVLPKRLSYLLDKSDRLVRLVEDTEDSLKWVNNMQKRHANSETSEEHIQIRIALSEKEYSYNKLFNEYMLLEREVVTSGQAVNSHLASEVKDLKSRWIKLCGDVRRITPVSIHNSKSGEIPKTSSSHSVSSFISLASLASPTSQSSEQWANSPTTASTSPMSEEIIPVTDQSTVFAEKSKSLLEWMNNLARDQGTDVVVVVDTDAVGKELDRFRYFFFYFFFFKF